MTCICCSVIEYNVIIFHEIKCKTLKFYRNTNKEF